MTTRLATSLTIACTALACGRAEPARAPIASAPPTTLPAGDAHRAILDRVQAVLDIGPLAPGRLTSRGDLTAFVDSASATTVILIQRITAIRLPDGPVTPTAPIALFQRVEGQWRDVAPQAGRDTLPSRAAAALTAIFSDTSRTYALLVRRVAADTTAESLHRLQSLRRALATQAAALLRDGFLGADAEP